MFTVYITVNTEYMFSLYTKSLDKICSLYRMHSQFVIFLHSGNHNTCISCELAVFFNKCIVFMLQYGVYIVSLTTSTDIAPTSYHYIIFFPPEVTRLSRLLLSL